MSTAWKQISAGAATTLLLLMGTTARAAQNPSSVACDHAWATYNDFKSRTAMAPSKYPLTIQGAAVRAACGKSALPAPANADQPPRHHIRRIHKPHKFHVLPAEPPGKPAPGRPDVDQGKK
ncbi:MAG: hypothetical protein EPN61_12660 [Burkholderiaceae bacterium]|nr:MAG: hypothetical protein EPN61_12660 [Burkholderiaceae bacterium]